MIKLTYPQFLESLEPDERDSFMNNTSREILDDYFSSKDTRDWLARAFSWMESTEGFDYWDDIHSRIFEDRPQ